MAKAYNRSAVENSWYAWWEKSNFFVAHASRSKPPFVIPQPNVIRSPTYWPCPYCCAAIQDTFIHWGRMSGFNAVGVAGMNHAEIATQVMYLNEILSLEILFFMRCTKANGQDHKESSDTVYDVKAKIQDKENHTISKKYDIDKQKDSIVSGDDSFTFLKQKQLRTRRVELQCLCVDPGAPQQPRHFGKSPRLTLKNSMLAMQLELEHRPCKHLATSMQHSSFVDPMMLLISSNAVNLRS
ncbi:hypothetical protein ACH5RR_024854 [Cinchona calisaya]|uniref:valine--tRNA ligase n=1 Tax=Cinchona calisaya TaxID=153742 RepID=A0ABD2Z151_9GENT